MKDLIQVDRFVHDNVVKIGRGNKFSLSKKQDELKLFYKKITESQLFVSFIQEVNYVGQGSKEHIEFR